MHPLKIDSMEKEARIIVLVKDGEIGGWAKLKQASQAIPVSIGPLQVNLLCKWLVKWDSLSLLVHLWQVSNLCHVEKRRLFFCKN